MNIGELIEKLKELNPNLPVYFGVSDTWFWSADYLEVCDPDNFGEDVCLIYHQVVEMKVKELIEKLQDFDPELDIYFSGNGTGIWFANNVENEYLDDYCINVCMIYH